MNRICRNLIIRNTNHRVVGRHIKYYGNKKTFLTTTKPSFFVVKKHNVILLKDVPGLGIEGQEVSVKFGYGRNYLLRQKIAVRSTEENLEKFAQENDIQYIDFSSLCQTKEINTLITDMINDLNRRVSRVEQIRDFRVLNVILNPEDEELTATMKIKRAVLEKKYSSLIKEMYD